MEQKHIVVLGAGYAGMLITKRLARKTTAHITLVNAAPTFVERVRLHQQAAGQQVVQYPIVEVLRGTGAEFMQGTVTAINPTQQSVSVKTEDGPRTLHYDTLVYALGSMIDRESVPGVREYAATLSPNTSVALHSTLSGLPEGSRLVICGGGLTGIEAATEMAEAYPNLRVTLVTRGEIGEDFSRKGRAYVRKVIARYGISMREHETITALTASEVMPDTGPIGYDVAIWAGAFAVPTLAWDSGITTNACGQIVVDTYLRSVSHPNIFAAGDSASPEAFHPALRMACAVALPLGICAADNVIATLRARDLRPFRFRYYIRCVSLGRKSGIVQIVKADDSPREQVFTGGLGAFIKERICRFAANTALTGGSYTSSYKSAPKSEQVQPIEKQAQIVR